MEVHRLVVREGEGPFVFRGESHATASDGWYERLKSQSANLRADETAQIEGHGRSYTVFETSEREWLLVITQERAIATGLGSVQHLPSASDVHRFSTAGDLLAELRSLMNPRDPDCPYATLLVSWGHTTLVEDVVTDTRRFDAEQ